MTNEHSGSPDDGRIADAVRALADRYEPSLTVGALTARRGHRRRTYTAAFAGVGTAVAMAAVVVAIGVGRGHPGTPAAVGPSPAPGPASGWVSYGQTSSPPASTSAPTSRSTQPAVAACAAGAVRVSVPTRGVGPTMPGTAATIVFTNTGPRPCSLTGWPAVTVSTPAGQPIPAKIDNFQATGDWSYPASPVTVPAGGTAKASLLINNPTSTGNCPDPFAWRIRIPGTSTPVVVPEHNGSIVFGVCPSGTRIVVSPVHRSAG